MPVASTTAGFLFGLAGQINAGGIYLARLRLPAPGVVSGQLGQLLVV
jgi:hypothetical protein